MGAMFMSPCRACRCWNACLAFALLKKMCFRASTEEPGAGRDLADTRPPERSRSGVLPPPLSCVSWLSVDAVDPIVNNNWDPSEVPVGSPPIPAARRAYSWDCRTACSMMAFSPAVHSRGLASTGTRAIASASTLGVASVGVVSLVGSPDSAGEVAAPNRARGSRSQVPSRNRMKFSYGSGVSRKRTMGKGPASS